MFFFFLKKKRNKLFIFVFGYFFKGKYVWNVCLKKACMKNVFGKNFLDDYDLKFVYFGREK